MTETRRPPSGSNSSIGLMESFVGYIHYGVSLIRQDGLSYFLKRLYQFCTWRVKAAYHMVRSTLSTHGHGQLIKIEDIQLNPQHELDQSVTLTPAGAAAAYHNDLILKGISSREQSIIERHSFTDQGRLLFSGRRILFVSPIRVLGGGANSILLAVAAMQRMGVDAQIMNLNVHRQWFEKNYPDLKLPVVFADVEDIPRQAQNFDAVIATSNPTVAWIAPAAATRPDLVMGYYIQDYEPNFYAPDTHEIKRAEASYTLIPNLVRMVTTPWIAEQIQVHHHIQSTIVGGHIDPDLFQPRRRLDPSWPDRPLRITAMIRPSTARRSPELTMAALQQAYQMDPSRVEIRLFGCDQTDPGFTSLERDFPWQLAGQLRSTQVANLFNEADIFVDFSDFQAFGLTAVEAMGCGLAVVVPANGGTIVYAQDEENCLVVDTHDRGACFETLRRLIEDDALRMKLQANAVSTAAKFFAELPVLNMLRALFPQGK